MDPNDFDIENEISEPADEGITEIGPETGIEAAAEARPNHDDWVRQSH
jgi:hypothetical protein